MEMLLFNGNLLNETHFMSIHNVWCDKYFFPIRSQCLNLKCSRENCCYYPTKAHRPLKTHQNAPIFHPEPPWIHKKQFSRKRLKRFKLVTRSYKRKELNRAVLFDFLNNFYIMFALIYFLTCIFQFEAIWNKYVSADYFMQNFSVTILPLYN